MKFQIEFMVGEEMRVELEADDRVHAMQQVKEQFKKPGEVVRITKVKLR